MTSRFRRRVAPGVALTALVLAFAACGGGGEMEVTGAWARTSPSMSTAGAAYMQITNQTGTSDALVGASVDPSVAATVEIHETVAMDDGTDQQVDVTGTTMGGPMMQMQPVDRIEISDGEAVSLEPGGYHVMLVDLSEPLESGASITLTLIFEEAGELEVTAEVRDAAP